MSYLKFVLALTALNPWFSVFSYQAQVTQHKVCIYKSVTFRSLRVHTLLSKCEVYYTRLGQDQLISEQNNNKECEDVFYRAVEQLENSGWHCKNSVGAQFTIEKV